MMAYVLAHTNKSTGWIGPMMNEPGDNNGQCCQPPPCSFPFSLFGKREREGDEEVGGPSNQLCVLGTRNQETDPDLHPRHATLVCPCLSLSVLVCPVALQATGCGTR